ncbi:MAG: elongation factor Ts [Gammaproteobacteria bacterium]|nr:elongation factor Ts [Gammaproteobacteria bacterium]
MTISAQLVKELRQRTGAGMMECKKALQENNGDIDAAIEAMRRSGLAKADKKSGRTAAEGVVVIKQDSDNGKVVIVEVNCETDFVAKGDDFQNFVDEVATIALNGDIDNTEALLQAATTSGDNIDEVRRKMVAKIGENITVRRLAAMTSTETVGWYIHNNRIAVVVALRGGSEDVARDVAMHVAAANPAYLNDNQVPADVLSNERDIQRQQAADTGKPADIVEKIVDGKLKKWLAEVTLVGQAFVKDPDVSIAKLLEQNNAEVLSFTRFEVGEGIEKRSENFADEVMEQVKSHATA